MIYDRKGRELAISLPMDSVFGDPAEITDPEMVARLLAPALRTVRPTTWKRKFAKRTRLCGWRKSSLRKPYSESRT